jgi:hypothetical protein
MISYEFLTSSRSRSLIDHLRRCFDYHLLFNLSAMDKYKILYDLTQRGWRMGKQQMECSTLTLTGDSFYSPYKLIILWDTMKYIHHNKRGTIHIGVMHLLEQYGFTEQKLPNEK